MNEQAAGPLDADGDAPDQPDDEIDQSDPDEVGEESEVDEETEMGEHRVRTNADRVETAHKQCGECKKIVCKNC